MVNIKNIKNCHQKSAFNAPVPKINIYQVADVVKVKAFDATDGNLDAFSVWKPKKSPGLYPIGDIFVKSNNKPGGAILARPINENDDSLREPLFYNAIKTLNKDYQNLFWWPVCPTKFVALGMVASQGYPGPKDFYCVNSELAGLPSANDGLWEIQWNRHGQFFKCGYKVYSDLWQTYQKLPFFSIALRGDAQRLKVRVTDK